MPMPRSTSREEQQLLLQGSGPQGGERLIEYNMFQTDAFGTRNTPLRDVQGPGIPGSIEGFNNDDSYRRSAHYLRNSNLAAGSNVENLRENSLARQLNEKEDRPATIRLIRRRKPEELAALNPTEKRVPWVNLIPPNTKFFLENVQENREEKVQVIDTFGEWVAFFFGRRPEIYNYSGTLLNAKNHDWKNEFQFNYDHFLRGSEAVKNSATVVLQYDDVIVEGYIMNSSIQMSSMADKAVPFSFSMLVISRSPLNPRAMIGLRFERSGGSTAEAQLFNTIQQSLNLANTNRVDEIETFFLMREYFSGNYTPSAGRSTSFEGTGTIQSESSYMPGQRSGLNNEKPVSQPFNNGNTSKVDNSGVTLPSNAGATDLSGIPSDVA